ncbi:phage tail spike protein [Clostridium sp. YIM B02555]|uniref:phage tail spike protein n=1 Tax=Clostridium sp. YIM B02555 TaxID=2911968 RepID=UPI001EEEA1A3|nr:phage tail spike protein [Clostridium sp. YIM B02555]
MIRLWESAEKNFKGNQWILSECTKCQITEIINGEFTLDLEYPLQDTKGISNYIVRGNIITCPMKDTRSEQQFRIRKVEKTSSKVIVYAETKLIADLRANRVRKMTIAGKTRKEAIQYILANTLEKNNFTVGNLDNNAISNVIVDVKEGSALEALIGKENSILGEYGGEFIINNNAIDIVDSRGSNDGFTISYGKNIASIKETIDDTDLVTVLIPKVGDLRLPEYYVESPKVNNYEKKYFKEIELKLKIWDGKGEKASNEVAEAEAYKIIRETCSKMFAEEKFDQINFNYSVDLVTLGKTEEYKEYAILENTSLGDLVEIKHRLLNLDLVGRINKTIYDVLSDKYIKLEIGFAKQDIADLINTTVKQIETAKQEVTLRVESMQNTLSTQIKLTEDTLRTEAANSKNQLQTSINQTASQIRQEALDTKNNLQSSITQNANKINAVVQGGNTQGSWELNKDAFKVAFSGASDGYTQINGDGITINDGKFRIRHDGETVFNVSKRGYARAVRGFEVSGNDEDTYCLIDSTGLEISNENGYTGRIEAHSRKTALFIPDDLYIGSNLNVSKYSLFNQDLDVNKDLWVGGDLDVEGSKPCLQNTLNYGKRRITAYETAEYYFGDIGEGVIRNGECIIVFEDIFKECVNTDISYQVFTQIYNGGISKIDRYPNYFIVYGENETKFAWEIKAKRKGYENVRLEEKINLKDDVENLIKVESLLKDEVINTENILLEGKDLK